MYSTRHRYSYFTIYISRRYLIFSSRKIGLKILFERTLLKFIYIHRIFNSQIQSKNIYQPIKYSIGRNMIFQPSTSLIYIVKWYFMCVKFQNAGMKIYFPTSFIIRFIKIRVVIVQNWIFWNTGVDDYHNQAIRNIE